MLKIGNKFVCNDTYYHGVSGYFEYYTEYKEEFDHTPWEDAQINAKDKIFVVQLIDNSLDQTKILFYCEELNWTGGQTIHNYQKRFRRFIDFSSAWRQNAKT